MTPAGQPPRRLQFELARDAPGVMDQVRRIEAFLLAASCSTQAARQFAVVAEEILVNIMQDAWPDAAPGRCVVEVTAGTEADAIEVSLRTDDDGVAFDPTAAPPPDLDAALEERPIGGLGIHLVRAMTDTQSYLRADGHNIFEVCKRCPRA